MKSFESIAQAAYKAFCASLPELPIMTWQELPGTTRQAWITAARKMAEEIQQVH